MRTQSSCQRESSAKWMRADTTLRTLETSVFFPMFISVYFYKPCINKRLKRRGGCPESEVAGLGGILWSFLSLSRGYSLQLSEEISKRSITEIGVLSRGEIGISFLVKQFITTVGWLSKQGALKTLHLPEIEAGFLSGSVVKESTHQCKTWLWSLGWKDPLEKGMTTHSSILAWEIPWVEEPGRLQFMELKKN